MDIRISAIFYPSPKIDIRISTDIQILYPRIGPLLKMISKDDFFILLYIKSKTAFKPYSKPLSKLVEQLKLRLQCNFERLLLEHKNVTLIFLKIAAPQIWHTFRGCDLHVIHFENCHLRKKSNHLCNL